MCSSDLQLNQAQIIKNMELNQEKIIADRAREIGSIQSKLLALEEKHIKEMNVMENRLKMMEVNHANQMSLQHKLLTVEESHVKEISVVKVKHYNQMIVIQNKLEKMERSYMQNSQPKSKLSTDHRPPNLLKQFPSQHREVSLPIKEN